MREIYCSAQEVLIWLGPESEDSPLAFELIDLLARSLRKREHLFSSSDEDTGRPLWEAYTSLCGRQWFRRVWVRQEVAVAKKATVMCGYHVADWRDLVDAFQEVTVLGLDRYAADLSVCEEGYGIISLRRRFQSDRGIELEDLLGGQKAACSDPRDKVYALIGLVTTPVAKAVKFDVNYSRPVPVVFTDLARLAIAAYKSVQVFGHVRENSNHAPRIKDLPSWVPDLSHPAHGPVTSLGSLLESPPTLFSKDQEKCAILQNWEDIAAEQAPYITGEAMSEAYTWTLEADANMPENGTYMYGCWASSVLGAEPISYRNSELDDHASGVSPNALSEVLQKALRKSQSRP